ncbi:expressed unknown protein [Seminavis robusta]|uniref:Uncharacterized protein n=1 Tax=Seminavis robusta TaxID=568900 RepID=A0A9N8DTA9_9STRA|nr:expressed unknown protein [Seminavis robusta]|eukprot:Sro341_g121410.1 n/a (759) ;mRNA; r:27266-29542
MNKPPNFTTRDRTALNFGVHFLSFREILAMKGPFCTRQEREQKAMAPMRPFSSANQKERPILLLFCSHVWETPHHPDPDKSQLNCLKYFIQALCSLYTTISDNPTTVDGFEAMAREAENLSRHGWIQAALLLGDMLSTTSGVVDLQLHNDAEHFLDRSYIWYDYACLYQHPRTPEQEKDFRWSLDNMDKLTRNCFRTIAVFGDEADYHSRGWCVFEAASSFFDRSRPIVLKPDLMGTELDLGTGWRHGWNDYGLLHSADRMSLRRSLRGIAHTVQLALRSLENPDLQLKHSRQIVSSGTPTILPLIVELREGFQRQHAWVAENPSSLFDFQKVLEEIKGVKCFKVSDKPYVILKTLIVFLPAFDSQIFEEALNRHSQGLPLAMQMAGTAQTNWFHQDYVFVSEDGHNGRIFRFGDFGDPSLPVVDITGLAAFLSGQTVPGFLNSISPCFPINPAETPDRPDPYTKSSPPPNGNNQQKSSWSILALTRKVCCPCLARGRQGPDSGYHVQVPQSELTALKNDKNTERQLIESFVVPSGTIARFDFSTTPLSRIIAAMHGDLADSKLLKKAIELQFLTEEVGIQVSGVPQSARRGHVIASDGGGLQVAPVAGPNNERFIKVCADPHLFQRNFPGQFNSTLSGREAIHMASQMPVDGLLICSAVAWRSFVMPQHEFPKYMELPAPPPLFTCPDDCEVAVIFSPLDGRPVDVRTIASQASKGAGSEAPSCLATGEVHFDEETEVSASKSGFSATDPTPGHAFA